MRSSADLSGFAEQRQAALRRVESADLCHRRPRADYRWPPGRLIFPHALSAFCSTALCVASADHLTDSALLHQSIVLLLKRNF